MSRKDSLPVHPLPIPVAAERLGCPQMHIYRLISAGELRAVDVGRPGSRKSKTRILSDDIGSYIETRTRQAGAGPRPAA